MKKLFTSLLALILLVAPASASYETGSAYQIMRVPAAGGRIVAGSIDLSQSAAVGSSLLGKANGGWGQSVAASTGVPSFAAGTITFNSTLTKALGGWGTDISASTGVPSFAAGTLTFNSSLTVPLGGTGLASITAHDLIIGNGTSAATLLAPSATSGVPVISQGSSSDPAYGTVAIAGGGTGQTTARAAFNAIAVGSDGTTDATAGNLGEQIESKVTVLTSMTAASNAYQDCTSVTLTAGDWSVVVMAGIRSQAATMTGIGVGISTATGNDSTGLTQGDNFTFLNGSWTTNADTTIDIPSYRVKISATTTYYAKISATYTSTAPKYICRLSARRVR